MPISSPDSRATLLGNGVGRLRLEVESRAIPPADLRPLRAPSPFATVAGAVPPPSFRSLRRASVWGGHVGPTAGECGGKQFHESPRGETTSRKGLWLRSAATSVGRTA